MSIMGTGVAASVAQTGLNAQQQARKTDKAKGDQQKVARDTAARGRGSSRPRGAGL